MLDPVAYDVRIGFDPHFLDYAQAIRADRLAAQKKLVRDFERRVTSGKLTKHLKLPV